jgi:DNA-binding NarL/FixJ family response regulator
VAHWIIIIYSQELNSEQAPPVEATFSLLTHRETQILNYIAQGNSNKQIGLILGVSQFTIKNHISNILRKLNARNRPHAVYLARSEVMPMQ